MMAGHGCGLERYTHQHNEDAGSWAQVVVRSALTCQDPSSAILNSSVLGDALSLIVLKSDGEQQG